MTIQEWTSCSPEERAALIHSWYERGEPFRLGQLATTAAEMLALRLKADWRVHSVQFAESPDRNCVLIVSTKTSDNCLLPGIPLEYAGFIVVQHGMADKKRRFLNTWLVTMKRLCDWDEARVQKEFAYFISRLDQSGDIVYYRGALYFVGGIMAKTFASQEFDGMERVTLEAEIANALKTSCTSEILHPDEDPAYNWSAAKDRIAQAFRKHGITWP